MDNKVEILLNSSKNITSINLDSNNKIQLNNNLSEINEYDIRNVVNSTEEFDIERESNEIYRIYGRIEYLSLLNGLKNDYEYLEDFFSPQTYNSKNIINSFDFYLVKPAVSGYTKLTTTGDISTWERYFQVIATPKDFEIYSVGFSNNVYGEQGYAFNFNVDIDISTYYDNFNFPITELFLYCQYKKTIPLVAAEELQIFDFQLNNHVGSKMNFNPTTLNIGDFVKNSNNVMFGDVIEYDKLNFSQTQKSVQQIFIKTYYIETGTTKALYWKYNPFIPLRLRYLTNDLYQANTGSTSYELVQSIPEYATPINSNGNYVWRNVMPEGYVDPLTGIGTDNPFVNKRRYLFNSIILDIIPDLNDNWTRVVFDSVLFEDDAINNDITPLGDINNIGKPCQ